ncbi:MAG: LytR C-terminal domain-containing protein [Candidatus Moranbacteria bacterium]|nr:LytR C-terminal domain-containing protein [Candidatus Moranbacteria bacterium]
MGKISKITESGESIEKFSPNEQVAAEAKTTKKSIGTTSEKKNSWGKKIASVGLLLVVLGLGATSYYFYHKYKSVPSVETDEIIIKVGKLMELPSNEIPTLATVTDKEKMKEQPFFAKSENGDKVLIYTKAQKAILYRPSLNKIVEVMQLSISKPTDAKTVQNVDQAIPQEQAVQDQAQTTAPAQNAENQAPVVAAEQTKLKVAIYNGSGIKGKAGTLADEIVKIEGLEVTEKTNATGGYDSTLVVDLAGGNEVMAQKIADALGAAVGQLPEGEMKPAADVLVIGGKN